MDFLTILQTHTLSNNQDYLGHKRYGSDSKAEVVKRCVRSLIASIESCKLKHPENTYRLMVLDDHSDDGSIEVLERNLARATFETSLEHLTTRGIMPSILACYERGRDHGRDLVYFAQDDYLFCDTAIEEMIDAYYRFGSGLQNHVIIYPFDDPYRYQPYNIFPHRIVLGIKRHWRTDHAMASCFMTHVDVIRKEWDLLEAMGRHPVAKEMEDRTINRLMTERGYFLFKPIPSVALHFQFDTEKDPYIDWREWWDQWADPVIDDPSMWSDPRTKILNLGAGRAPLDYEPARDWREIRVDLDERVQPDIVDDIIGLAKIPDASVDVVWASHVLEHIHWHEVPKALAGISRVLKPDGHAILITPDLASIADRVRDDLLGTVYDSPAGPIAALDMLFGYRPFVESMGDFMAHKTGFTPGSMLTVLRHLGYQALLIPARHDLVTIIHKGMRPVDAAEAMKAYFNSPDSEILDTEPR